MEEKDLPSCTPSAAPWTGVKPSLRPCMTPHPHFMTDIELYDGLFAGGVAAASHDTYLQNKVDEVSAVGAGWRSTLSKQSIPEPVADQQFAAFAPLSHFCHTPVLLLLQLEELLRERDMQLRKLHKQLENREGEVSARLARTLTQ